MKLTYIKETEESDGAAGDKYIGLDRFGRIVDQRWRKGSTDIDRYKYGYDRNSNRLYRDNTLDNNYDELYHADGASNGYDSLDQLVEFQRGALSDSNSDNIPDTVTTASRTQAWTLDAQGNWSTLNTDGTGVNRTHNAQNELTAVGSNNLAYDLNGNMTTDETNKDFVWDAWNRLVEVKDSSDANLISYTYDALGRRVTEDPTGSSNTRDLFYSAQWQVVEDWTNSLIANSYVWSPVYIDSLIVRDRNTDGDTPLEERFYPTHDANFNVTALVNGSGVQERYVYDPYGAQTVLDASWTVQGGGSSYVWILGHQGLRQESATGLLDARFRPISWSLGRPVSEDPITFGGGYTNLFVLVGNNPLKRLDPLGLQSVERPLTPRRSPPEDKPLGQTPPPPGVLAVFDPKDTGKKQFNVPSYWILADGADFAAHAQFYNRVEMHPTLINTTLDRIDQHVTGWGPMDEIRFYDHSVGGSQQVGNRSLNSATDAQLQRLGGFIKKGGVLTLYGCHAGSDTPLIKRILRLNPHLGGIRASTQDVWWWPHNREPNADLDVFYTLDSAGNLVTSAGPGKPGKKAKKK